MTVTCKACGQQWLRDPALEVPCPHCFADVGIPCRRPSGHGCNIHPARDRAAMDRGFLKRCPAADTKTPGDTPDLFNQPDT